MKKICLLLTLSFTSIPFFVYGATGTGIIVNDVTYTADAHTAQITLVYTYPELGEAGKEPKGFTLDIVGVTDPEFSYSSLSFGPTSEEPGLDTRTATYTVLGLEPSAVYSYEVKATDIAVDAYWKDTIKTGVSDGEFISGDTVPALGTPTEDAYYFLAPLPLNGVQIDAEGNQFINIGSTDGPTGPNFDFGDYVNGLLTFAIGIAGALAVVMIVVGGVQYMSTDNFGEKAQGKEHIKNSLGGLILLIGSYMILNTLNPDLVNFNFEVKGVAVKADPIIDASSAPEKNADGTYNSSLCTGYKDGAVWPSDIPSLRTNIENPLAGSPPGLGIDVTSSKGTEESGYCKNVGDSGCTSVYYTGSASTAVNSNLSTIKSNCTTCNLIVTGGSECWLHKTHGPNAAVVDMSVDAGLTKYITGNATFPTDCSWRNLPKPFTKGQALAESASCEWKPAPHWHINFDKPFI